MSGLGLQSLEQPLQLPESGQTPIRTHSSQSKFDLATLNLDWLSSAAIRGRGAVKKLMRYTQGLSIQIDGGCHFTAGWPGVCGSSFLQTCLWGGCSKIHSEVMSV